MSTQQIQPQDLPAERAVLAILANMSHLDGPEAAKRLADESRLRPDDFARPEHRDVWNALRELFSRGSNAEAAAVWALLRNSPNVQNVGGAKWYTALVSASNAATSVALPVLAEGIREQALRRDGILLGRSLAVRFTDPSESPDKTLANGQEAWAALVNRQTTMSTAEPDLMRLGESLDSIQRGEKEPIVPTGLAMLDDVIGGLQNTLTVIGALPGVGKSALLATVLRNVAFGGRRVGLFSLEDEREWVVRRLVADEANVPLFVLANRPLSDAQMKRVYAAGERTYAAMRNMIIDDRLGLTAPELVQAAKDMVVNYGVRAIFVDHLGELRYTRSERFDLDIAEALQQLRGIAKQHGVPVIVACHLKRRSGLEITEEPTLTDFANSASIERMARVALGLSKPDQDTLRITVLKQTQGKSGCYVDLPFIGASGLVGSQGRRPEKSDYDRDEENMLKDDA